ncbi:hypothetical protein PC129_g17468 [Phytophthora cactorum]|uniref:Uncharacterized protein n=1 Tax=Phytophthora cactorum TaxID=29920 RepID=A0A8T1HJQ7_9STRA|nr:hypothetical protein PC129_g17468 [Phytophthora cactorum]
MAHTGVSGSDSKILNAAVGPCDAEDGVFSDYERGDDGV